ncbi:MAG: Ig-like domain-containing protein [Pirellulaceae bacterium]|nr:Ig-like domain-containing protein [Pirellulaceae bacterium]
MNALKTFRARLARSLKKDAKKRRRNQRRSVLESLEPRIVLNAAPIIESDLAYATPVDTPLSAYQSVLDNDWDPEGASLTPSVVQNPSNGTLDQFNADGTFEYTPDFGFEGFDTFTYKVNDGSVDSVEATVSIAVGNLFGSRTNQEELSRGGDLMTGAVTLAEPLTPGLALVYNSTTLSKPIIAVDTFMQQMTPSLTELKAKLTFAGNLGSEYEYNTMGVWPGSTFRIALQAEPTLLSGNYEHSMRVTAVTASGSTDHVYTGRTDLVNRNDSAFGKGWHLAGLDELAIQTDGVLLVYSHGESMWFADDGQGGFESAEGDPLGHALVKNGDDTYTITDKHGVKANFSSAGDLTSRVDTNGNTVTYTYTSGLLTKITDVWGRDTTLTYSSSKLSSVTDYAGRVATVVVTSEGLLSSISQPDPDGAGPLTSPATIFSYDSTTNLLTMRDDAVSNDTHFTYGTHGRLTEIRHADDNTWQLVAPQTVGLPTGASGNSVGAVDPAGQITDERGKISTYRTNRFGGLKEYTDPNGTQFLTVFNDVGLVARTTAPDPDDAGPLEDLVSITGFDVSNDLVYAQNADGTSLTWTYDSTHHQVLTSTDELGRVITSVYDANGNLTSVTDGEGFVTTFVVNSNGLVTSVTTPDPDDTGPQTAATTSMAYDANGRMTTLTNPDSTTVVYAYDSADNATSITDELGNATTFAYDSLDRLTSATDRESATTLFSYNGVNQLITQTDALGNATDWEYNNRGWLEKQELPDPDGAGPLSRPEFTFVHDEAGNVIEEVEPQFATATKREFEYDDNNNRIKEIGPVAGWSVDYAYDILDRLISIPDGETGGVGMGGYVEYQYDARGNVVKRTDPDPDDGGPAVSPETSFTFDAAGQLASTTDPRGYVTNYYYDDRGLMTTVVQPVIEVNPAQGPTFRPTTHFAFDDAGRMTSVTDPLGRATTYELNNRDWVTCYGPNCDRISGRIIAVEI